MSENATIIATLRNGDLKLDFKNPSFCDPELRDAVNGLLNILESLVEKWGSVDE